MSMSLWSFGDILVVAKAYVFDWTTFFNRPSYLPMKCLSLVGIIIPMDVCVTCEDESDERRHLFMEYSFAKTIWYILEQQLKEGSDML